MGTEGMPGRVRGRSHLVPLVLFTQYGVHGDYHLMPVVPH